MLSSFGLMAKSTQLGHSTSKFLSKGRLMGLCWWHHSCSGQKQRQDWECQVGDQGCSNHGWIIGSVKSNIVLNLGPSKTSAEMWTHPKKLYSQHNTACWFQLENELATL